MPKSHQAAPPAPKTPLWRRAPWFPVIVTLLVLVSAAFAVSPLRDAVTLQQMPDVALALPAGYVVLAPLSDVLDTLTLLTVRQHIALLIWAIALFAVWRAWRGRPRESAGRRAAHELAYAALLLVVIVAIYAVGAIVPRPMAQLTIADPAHADVLAIDFHSHTKYSHDGRRGWTADDVRAWHRDAGFDVAYISDHATFAGAEEGVAYNPPQAGEGTVLLQAIEAFYNGEHVNVLGAGRRYRGLVTPDMKDVDVQSLALASAIPGYEPVLIETIPGKLQKIIGAKGPGTPGVRAIEVIDGAPRGLQQTRRQRSEIVRIADSLHLALVAGSDNHGWGHTAPGWTLMDIPGWRGMAADSLELAIERAIRVDGTNATRVIERRVADPGTNAVALVLAPWGALWRMLTTLSIDERVMWIVWTWAIAIGLYAARMRLRRTHA